jgi:hypothetical protein
MITTTGNDVNGHVISDYLGIVRGIVVRSPTIGQGMLGGLKQIIGGNIERMPRSVRQRVRKRTSEWFNTPPNETPTPSSACGTTRPSSRRASPKFSPTVRR